MIRAGSRLRSPGILSWWVCLLFTAILAIPQSSAVEPPTGKFHPVVDLFMMIGKTPVWFGSTIGYTVYEPVQVEARVLTVTGEIIILLQEGEKQPGQYVLPFDGTADGSPLAGYYTFELYFGDDFAAKFRMIASPVEEPL